MQPDVLTGKELVKIGRQAYPADAYFAVFNDLFMQALERATRNADTPRKLMRVTRNIRSDVRAQRILTVATLRTVRASCDPVELDDDSVVVASFPAM